MDLQGIVFLDNTILPERLPCRFLFLARYPVCKMQAPFLQPFFNAKVELRSLEILPQVIFEVKYTFVEGVLRISDMWIKRN